VTFRAKLKHKCTRYSERYSRRVYGETSKKTTNPITTMKAIIKFIKTHIKMGSAPSETKWS
jgi:hypothetical protein